MAEILTMSSCYVKVGRRVKFEDSKLVDFSHNEPSTFKTLKYLNLFVLIDLGYMADYFTKQSVTCIIERTFSRLKVFEELN